MRADFEHDIPGIAEHPEIEWPRLELIQFPVPRDRDVIGLPKSAGPQILPELLVNGREEVVMIDPDHDVVDFRHLDKVGAVTCPGRHGFFEEDMDSVLDQGGRCSGVQVGRKQDVNHVEGCLFILQHVLE